MIRIRLFYAVLLLGTIAGSPAAVSAQNTGAPEAVVEIVNDVKLGVQAQAGGQHRDQSIQPVEARSPKYVQRPVSGDLSYSIPYYGVGGSLRFRGAEVGFTYRDNLWEQRSWLQFRDGSTAIPFSPQYTHWSLRAEYFVFDWIGIGGAYRKSRILLRMGPDRTFRVNGRRVRDNLFRGVLNKDAYTVYLPVRKRWGSVRMFGRVGASLYGAANESYDTPFVSYQNPEQPDEPTRRVLGPPAIFSADDPDPMNLQFGRVGVEVPVWRLSVRTHLAVQRLEVPGLSTTWSYDVQLEIGLPF